ncbi:MAG TPA: hypothetical protein VKA55_06255 [Gammaproteobacteria bacterium]|nr:hypothetical protein [Gammaproteobacteria bacterium]
MPLTRMGPRFLAGLMMAALAGPVVGQPSSPPGQPGSAAASSKLEKARQKAQSLQKKIGNLQSQALENNPDLRKRQEQLKQRVQKKMAENGFSADKQQRFKSLRGSLGQQGTAGKASREDMQDLRKLMKARRKAQQQAMQDPGIQKARQGFRDDLMAAMKEEDPKAPQLVSKLRKQVQEFRRLKRQQAGPPRGASQPSQP